MPITSAGAPGGSLHHHGDGVDPSLPHIDFFAGVAASENMVGLVGLLLFYGCTICFRNWEIKCSEKLSVSQEMSAFVYKVGYIMEDILDVAVTKNS